MMCKASAALMCRPILVTDTASKLQFYSKYSNGTVK